MKTFIKYNNLAFAIIFALATVVELIGFIIGHVWCIWAAIPMLLTTVMFINEYKKEVKQR